MSAGHPDAEATSALQYLAARYWAQADGIEPLAIAELFTQDSVLELGQLKLEGCAAIAEFFARREADRRAEQRNTRHLASNFLAVSITPDLVRIKSTVAVFVGSGTLPLPIELPSGIADFEDVCIRTPDGRWLFHSRCGRTVFFGPSAAAFAR